MRLLFWLDLTFAIGAQIYIGVQIVRSWRDKWVYLGYTEINHHDPKTKKVWFKKTLHYYAKGDYWSKRKVTWEGSADDYTVKRHPFYQQAVIPWLNGSAVFSDIRHPSGNLKLRMKILHKIEWSESNNCWRHIVPGLLRDD